MRLSERLYRALLFFYPSEFRWEYGADMAELYRERRRDEGPLALWLHLIADLFTTAPKEHSHMLMQDLRFAVRSLRRTPTVTLAAIATLALGIGANTAIFSVLHAVMLRPLPFPEPGRLVRLWETNPKLNIPFFSASVLNYLSWKEHSRSFEHLGAFGGASLNLTGDGEPENLPGGSISPSMFPLLGIRPLLGRAFRDEEEKPGQNRVVLLSEALWKRRFGADPGIVGRTIQFNGVGFTVVGVAPPEFRFPPNAQIWVPLTIAPERERRGNHVITVVGRLRPGVTIEQAHAEMNAVAQRLEQDFPDSNKGWGVRLATFYDWIIQESLRRTLLILAAAVGFVLAIACANVANLLLARATARTREIAVRLAMGASRRRLFRLLLTESAVLATAGGAVGCLIAFWGVSALRTILPRNIPRIDEIAINPSVLAFALLVSLATGLLFGLAPAWQATRADLSSSLKEASRTSAGGGRALLRDGLVVTEVALAAILLAGAALMIQSFLRMQKVSLGFDPDRIATSRVTLPQNKYPRPEARWQFYRGLLEDLKTTPGVESAAISSGIPFGAGDFTSMAARAASNLPMNPAGLLSAQWRIVSGDYFRTMRIPLLRGRTFAESDGPNVPMVIIISDEMARRLWPNGDAVGQILEMENKQPYAVVGVVGDVRHFNFSTEPSAAMYFSASQSMGWPTMTVVVRTTGAAATGIALTREKIRRIDPHQPLFNVRTMDQWLELSATPARFNSLLLGLFAAVALLLAAIGIYGVLSYSVARRTQEIGVRMALGAKPADVLCLVAGHGMRLGLIGIALGIAGSLALARLMETMLYQVKPRDPATLAIVSLALAAVALAACTIPARRATRVDPVIALRYE